MTLNVAAMIPMATASDAMRSMLQMDPRATAPDRVECCMSIMSNLFAVTQQESTNVVTYGLNIVNLTYVKKDELSGI